MLGATHQLFSGFIESTNDILYLLLGFHSSFLSSANTVAFYFLTVGIVLFTIAMLTGIMRISDLHQAVGAMVLTGIALVPVQINEYTYRSTAFENTSNRSGGSLTYTVALGPHLIWATLTNLVDFLEGSKDQAIFDEGVTAGGRTDEGSNFYAYAQALQIANSRNAYLLQSTPLATNLMLYNQQCNRVVQVHKQSGGEDIEDTQWLSVGLAGGGSYLFFTAADEVGKLSSIQSFMVYEGNAVTQWLYKSRGVIESAGSLISSLFGIGGEKRDGESISSPRHATLEALRFPAVQVDLTDGLMVPNEKYWKSLAAEWSEQLAEGNDQNVYERIRDINRDHDIKKVNLADAAISNEYLKMNRDPDFLPVGYGDQQNLGFESFTYHPGDCYEFYQVMKQSWIEFANGVTEYMGFYPDHTLDRAVLSTAVLTAVSSIQTDARYARDNDSVDTYSLDYTGSSENIEGAAENGFSIISAVANTLDSLLQAFTMYVMGPRLISQLSVAAALLFVLSPVVLVLQLFMPGRPALIKTLAVSLGMIFFFVGFIGLASGILNLISELVLTQSILTTNSTHFYPDGPGYFDTDRLSAGNSAPSVGSIDRFLVGVDSIAVMLFSVGTYVTYTLFMGDSALEKNRPSSGHAGKIAAGIVGAVAFATGKVIGAKGSPGKESEPTLGNDSVAPFSRALPPPSQVRIGDGPTGGTSTGNPTGKSPNPSGGGGSSSVMDNTDDMTFAADLSDRFMGRK